MEIRVKGWRDMKMQMHHNPMLLMNRKKITHTHTLTKEISFPGT